MIVKCPLTLNNKGQMPFGLYVSGLISISILLHLVMGISLGAKYWWDTIAYFQLADALRHLSSLHALYSGPFGIIYQHLMPGLPAMILLFERLFGGALWPTFAIFQNGLDVIACVYLATSFSGKLSKIGQLAFVVLTALFPYFSAFHNAILTESITSSFVMLMVGVTVRCFEDRIELTRAVVAILFLGIVGGNFRSYVLLLGGGLSALAIYYTARFSRLGLYAITVTAVVIGASIFPVYRTLAGLEFYYPRVDALMLAHASLVNWNLDERSRKAVESTVFDPEILEKLENAGESVDPDDIVKMVEDLVDRGLSRSQAARQISRASWIVRTQSWQVIRRQLQLSLSSLGFQRVAICCESTRPLRNGGFTAERMLRHMQYYYAWNAGLDPVNYAKLFDEFATRYRAAPRYYSDTAINWYTGRVRPYVLDHPSRLRNSAGLANISPDALVILGLLGFIILARRDWRIIPILGVLVIPVYFAALYATFVGDNRHAHLLWPFYILGIVALLEHIFRPFIYPPRLDPSDKPESAQGHFPNKALGTQKPSNVDHPKRAKLFIPPWAGIS